MIQTIINSIDLFQLVSIATAESDPSENPFQKVGGFLFWFAIVAIVVTVIWPRSGRRK